MIFISNLWLHDGFHSCLFLYSCMLRGSVGFLPGHKPEQPFLYMQLTIYTQLSGTRYPMACTCSTFTHQWKNVCFGIAVNDVILSYIIYVTLRRFVFIWLFLGLVKYTKLWRNLTEKFWEEIIMNRKLKTDFRFLVTKAAQNCRL